MSISKKSKSSENQVTSCEKVELKQGKSGTKVAKDVRNKDKKQSKWLGNRNARMSKSGLNRTKVKKSMQIKKSAKRVKSNAFKG